MSNQTPTSIEHRESAGFYVDALPELHRFGVRLPEARRRLAVLVVGISALRYLVPPQ